MNLAPSLPYVERNILGAMMVDEAAAVSVIEIISEEDFFVPANADLFRVLKTNTVAGKIIDPVLIAQSIPERMDFISEILSEMVSWADIPGQCRAIKEKAKLRKLVVIAGRISASALADDATYREAQAAAEAMLLSNSEGDGERGPRSLRECFIEAAKKWDRVANGETVGVLTGLSSMDAITGGLAPGKHIILAARPGVGKSALSLQVAKQCKVMTVIYSMEMLAEENAERIISQHTEGISSYVFNSQIGISQHKAAIAISVAELAALPIRICDDTTLTIPQIHAQCRRMMRDGLGLVVIDYLQLVRAHERKERRDLDVGTISRGLKHLALDLRIPVISVASLSRENERREDKRPMLSDLRESGSIESDADIVFFLHREAIYRKNLQGGEFESVTELICAKNRGGKTGSDLLRFDGARTRFTDMRAEDKTKYRQATKGKDGEDGWG